MSVSENEIANILDAIVGTTSPQADTTLDEISQGNVPRFEAVCKWVWDRLCSADGHFDSQYASARRTARMVELAAGDLALVFIEEREGDAPC